MERPRELSIRRKKRYSHVFINLMIKSDSQWKRIRATDWNEDGFNFLLDQGIEGKEVFFKKGEIKFTAEIVWSHKTTDESFCLELVLNRLIFDHLKQLAPDKEIAWRIIKLTRSPGLIEEKKKLLSVINRSLVTDDDFQALLKEEKSRVAVYRFGVRTESLEWNTIVRSTLQATEFVLKLDKVGERLADFSTIFEDR